MAVVVFFGFTQCPDACPTTMSALAEAMKLLGPEADSVQVLFVTIDPARDTPALLAQYVPAFDPRFLGLTGDDAATERAARTICDNFCMVPLLRRTTPSVRINPFVKRAQPAHQGEAR
jgi:protein SCO1/2